MGHGNEQLKPIPYTGSFTGLEASNSLVNSPGGAFRETQFTFGQSKNSQNQEDYKSNPQLEWVLNKPPSFEQRVRNGSNQYTKMSRGSGASSRKLGSADQGTLSIQRGRSNGSGSPGYRSGLIKSRDGNSRNRYLNKVGKVEVQKLLTHTNNLSNLLKDEGSCSKDKERSQSQMMRKVRSEMTFQRAKQLSNELSDNSNPVYIQICKKMKDKNESFTNQLSLPSTERQIPSVSSPETPSVSGLPCKQCSVKAKFIKSLQSEMMRKDQTIERLKSIASGTTIVDQLQNELDHLQYRIQLDKQKFQQMDKEIAIYKNFIRSISMFKSDNERHHFFKKYVEVYREQLPDPSNAEDKQNSLYRQLHSVLISTGQTGPESQVMIKRKTAEEMLSRLKSNEGTLDVVEQLAQRFNIVVDALALDIKRLDEFTDTLLGLQPQVKNIETNGDELGSKEPADLRMNHLQSELNVLEKMSNKDVRIVATMNLMRKALEGCKRGIQAEINIIVHVLDYILKVN